MHGIVVVTFFFVVCGEVEIISVIPSRNDRSVCAMLANLTPLQDPLIRAASTDGDVMPIEVELIGSWARKWVQAADAGEALSALTGPGMRNKQSICSNWPIDTYPRDPA